MAGAAARHEALRESVRDASETTFLLQNLVGVGLLLSVAGAACWPLLHGRPLWAIPPFHLILSLVPAPLLVGGGVTLAAAAGLRLGTRRSRRLAQALPRAELPAALRPLLGDPDPVTRKVAVRLLKELRAGDTELVACAAPEGRGSEAAAAACAGKNTR